MKLTSLKSTAIFVSGILVCAELSSAQQAGQAKADQAAVSSILENWPETARASAEKTIEKYGQPNEATASMLVWHNNGPWKRTVVAREEVEHNFPKDHVDVLEQSINYRVPPDKFDELAKFDGSVIAERTKGELSARCDREEMNFLALNLAHEIVTGKRTVTDAREFYAKTAMLKMAGKSSPYTEKLLFKVSSEKTGDTDERVLPGESGKPE